MEIECITSKTGDGNLNFKIQSKRRQKKTKKIKQVKIECQSKMVAVI